MAVAVLYLQSLPDRLLGVGFILKVLFECAHTVSVAALISSYVL